MSKRITGGPGTSPARESRSGWRETNPNRNISPTGIPSTTSPERSPRTFDAMPGMGVPRAPEKGRRNVVVTGQTPWPEGV